MDWIGLAVGAAAGVLAVLVSAGIMKVLGRSPTTKGYSVLYILLFVGGVTLGREFVEPRIQAQRVESGLLELPIYRALQEYEPEAYARIRTTIKHGVARRQPKEEVWANTRSIIGEVMKRRLPHASDEALVGFGQHLVSAMATLHSKGGTSCFSYVNPIPGEALDFNALLGADASERELNLVANVVISAAGKSRHQVVEAEIAPDLDVVVSKLLTRFNQSDRAQLQNPHAPSVDKRRYCELFTDLYKESVALPAPRNALMVRYLVQAQ
jgi:hypothetical protein